MLRFARYIQENISPSARLADFTAPNLQAFLQSEIDAGYHPHTIARRLVSLKAFNFFLDRPVTSWESISALAAHNRDQRRGQNLLPSLQQPHLSAVWSLLEQAPQARARRDQALLALLLETGLPVQRLLAINLADLSEDCHKLILTQPAGTGTSITLEWAGQPLRRYIKEGRPELIRQPEEPALWLSQSGRRMTRQAVWQALHKWGHRASLPYPLSPRLLSNTAAQRLILSGLPLKQIQVRLGHQSSLSTLARVRRIVD